MLKKIGLPLMAMAAVFMLAPHQVKADEPPAPDAGTSADCPPPPPPASTYVYANPDYVYAAPTYVAADRHDDRRRDDRREHRGERHDRDRR